VRYDGGWRAQGVDPDEGTTQPTGLLLPRVTQVRGLRSFGAFFLAWLAAMTAIPASCRGGPTSGMPGCPWPLEDHGAVTCVSHAAYLQAGAAVERFAASVVMSLFLAHFGVVTSEIVRRRGSVG
jgi:hypothetical protein